MLLDIPIIWRAIKAAKPEFSIALLIAKAQAIVIRISQDIYLVYFFGGKILVHAIMMVVMQTKKNISSRISGNASFTTGNSPIVAPTIIKISKPNASQRFLRETGSVPSLPLASKRKTLDSPHVGTNVSSAQRTSVSPSCNVTLSRSRVNRCPPLFTSFTIAP